MKLSSLSKCLYVRTGVTVVATILLIVFIVLPLRQGIVSESEEIQKDYAKTENAQKRILELPNLRSKFQKISDESDKTGIILPESQVVDLIKNLEDMARETGGEITVSKGADLTAPKKAARESDAGSQDGSGDDRIAKHLPEEKTFGLSVSFSGKYADAVNFLHKVETAAYFLDILSLDIRPVDTNSGDRGGLFTADPSSVALETGAPTAPAFTSVRAVFELVVYLK